MDATYFGSRKEGLSWCVVVFRDLQEKENLWWCFSKTETTSVYLEGKLYLEKLGYIILSVTGDGFTGIRTAFSDILFQMCHAHMERLIITRTTQKPKLEAGKVLLALIRTLHKTNKKQFKGRFKNYLDKYRDFLNEKTINPITKEKYFTHFNLRKATMSLVTLLPYLFTYEKDKNINKTTNSLEGHFSHIKNIVGIHRGLSMELKQKVLHTILLASTIAPSDEKLKEIL